MKYTRGKSSSSEIAMYGYDLSSRRRMLNRGLYCLMKFCSTSSASDSLLTTSASIWSIMPSSPSPPRVLGFEKWDATRLRIEIALPT